MKDNLAKKFLKFSYGSWVGLILGLLITMLTTRILPPEAFGKASFFDLFIQVGMILTIFGADQSFGRFFYEERPEKRGTLLYNCLKLPMVTTLIMVGMVLIFYKPITLYLFGEDSLQLAITISIGIVLQLLFRFGQLVLRMQQKGNLYSLIQIFQKVINLSFVIIFFYLLGSTFRILVFSKIITLCLLVIISIYFGKNLWNFRHIKTKHVKHNQSEIFKFGAPFVLTIFISWLFEAFDKIAIRQWSTFDELGIYSAAMKLIALVMVLKTTFSTFWTPVAYERFEENPQYKDFFKYLSIIISFVMCLVAILSIAAKDLIVILLGDAYQSASTILPFLVFMPILYTISETTVIGINFYKKVNWHILIAAVSCGFNIIGNWLLVPNFGAIGASVSTAFAYIIFFTLRTVISLKYFKVNYPLVRIYVMVAVISIYAFLSIIIQSSIGNLLFAFIPLLVLISIFYNDLRYILKNRTIFG